MSVPALQDLLQHCGGQSFDRGLYRFMTPETIRMSEAFLNLAFPSFAGKEMGFSYDWLGRIFALDSARFVGASPAVTMFEPGNALALEIPCDIVMFHENELVDHCEDVLAAEMQMQWLAREGPAPSLD